MLQIAICDDNPKELATLLELTYEYIKSNGIIADIIEFSHPDTLLSVCDRKQFHLYILDIVMPMVDGISLGKGIRLFDKGAQIIYVTTEEHLALQSFAANPINFLVKPVDKQSFRDTLKLALSKIELQDETITIKTREAVCTVLKRKILCCDYIDRGVRYTLLGGEVIHGQPSRQSFSQQIAPLLGGEDFVQPHVSFAVNMRYAEKLTREQFVLQGGITVPVSKKQYTSVRDAYINYRLKREVR